jgi:hypothetical protein
MTAGTRVHIQDCIECTGEVLGIARRVAYAWGKPPGTGSPRLGLGEIARLMNELYTAVVRADDYDARLDALLVEALQETGGTLELIIPGEERWDMTGALPEDDEPTLVIPSYAPSPALWVCLRCGQPYPRERLVTVGAGGPVCERCAAVIEETLDNCIGPTGSEAAP